MSRFIVWFAFVGMIISAFAFPAYAAPTPPVTEPQALSERVYVPIVSTVPPATVRVRNFTTTVFGGSGNEHRIIGEVINDTAQPVYLVDVEVAFLDANDHVLRSDIVPTMLERVAPGQRSPFVHTTTPPTGSVRHAVRVANWEAENTYLIEPLAVLSQQTEPNNTSAFLGEVRNTMPYDLVDSVVVVTTYNAQGDVLQAGTTWVPRWNISPGDTTLYQSLLNGSAYTTFTVQAEGYAAEPLPRSAVRITNQSTTPVPNDFGDRIIGEVVNDGASAAYYAFVEAMVYDANNRLVDSNYTYAYPEAIAARQRAPFEFGTATPPAGGRTVLRVSAYPEPFEDYRALTIVSRTVTQGAAYGTNVRGTVRNPTNVPLTQVRVIGSLYDAAGKLVDVVQGGAEVDVMPAGTQAPYTASSQELPPYTSIVLQSQGYVPTTVQAQAAAHPGRHARTPDTRLQTMRDQVQAQ